MHEQRPSETEGEYLPPVAAEPPKYAGYTPSPPPQRPGWRSGAGVLGAIGLVLLKFKGLLLVLLNLKWLIFLPKIALSFGSMFLSVWVYALLFGWKFGVAFVALILVHELGHYVTFRNFGIKASLPYFIPGFGAFVAAREASPGLTVDAIVTLAGPIFGIAASAICYGYAIANHEPFWYAVAFIGFLMNAFNLLPVPPFDGGGIAAAIDPRLWILGVFGFVAFLVYFGSWSSPFTLIMVAFVAIVAVPRIIAMWKGYVDPRFADVARTARIAIALTYFVTLAIATAGVALTHADSLRAVGS